MKMLEWLPLVLCLTVSSARAADNDFTGVGVELRLEGQTIVVNHIPPDTPAAAQKDLHVGDRIVAVAQGKEPAVQVENLIQTARLMRGPKGTAVRLTIIPAGEDYSQVRELSFVRGEVKTPWGDGVLLAIGTEAPEIEMVEVANKAGERLSNYAGKIMVLEFWATWCGPCQRKMAELQSYPGKHPEWQSKVMLVAASIDQNTEVAAKHLKAKGWNQTHNVWVQLSAIRAYHINAIPTVYVIDRQGKVVAVNPRDLSQVVNHELEEKQDANAR
jgi:thiol-disulfide isomerase/thioredoxin